MSKHSSPHDWLNLVQLSGLLVSEPVLATAFPDGPERVPSHVYRRFGREWERVSSTRNEAAAQSRWIDFVLEDLLELRRESRRKSNDLPEGVSVSLMEYSQTLRPSRVLINADGKPALLVSIVPPAQNLDKAETQTGRWKASPFTKLDRLLRETGVPLGLLTNGVEWRLVYAEKSLTTASITWTANEWSSEKTKLDAFYTLLNVRRFRHSEEPRSGDEESHSTPTRSFASLRMTLLELIKQSQARQIDVADQLGEQVRAAVEVFVRALDEADRAAGGAILAGMALDRVYEMALSLMMRLVFVLYAEENGLLPHGEVLYDRAYGLTHLVYRLEQDRQSDGERLAQTYDAWPQLLATFRLIHAGCPHPDLILLAYGGELFDPARYLNAAGTPVLEHPQLRIDNAAIYAILRKLTFARARLGRETLQRRVSYRTLDIEQIGYVYEGLLDHKLARAGDEVRVKLAGRVEAIVLLSELVGQDDILSYISEKTDRKPETIGRLLAAINDDDVIELREAYGSDMADRIAPYAGVIAADGVIWPDRLYVTAGESRRATGAHYTPQTLTEPIVRATLEPLLYRGAGPKPAQVTFGTGSLIGPREILNLKVRDMAMGSASFHVQADRYVAERLVEAWDLIEHERPGLQITPFGEASRAERVRYLDAPRRFPEFGDLIQRHRSALVTRLNSIFTRTWPADAAYAVAPDQLGQYLDEMTARLQQHTDRLFRQVQMYNQLLRDLRDREDSGVSLTDEERRRRRQFETARHALEQQSLNNYSLSYLANDGFFPGYALARESVLATSLDPLLEVSRPAATALRELTPANQVYANKNVFAVQTLNFYKLKALDANFAADQLIRRLRFDPNLERVYEPASAGITAVGGADEEILSLQLIDVELSHVQKIDDRQDTRRKVAFDIYGMLLGSHAGGHQGHINELTYRFLQKAAVRLVNIGPTRPGPASPKGRGFPICPQSGEMRSPFASVEEIAKFRQTHLEQFKTEIIWAALHVDIPSDVLIIGPFTELPGAVNVAEALRIGARMVLDMGESEIDAFVMSEATGQYVALYDPLPGGSGFLPQILRYWPTVCQRAVEVLGSCHCKVACYNCLLHFRNQQWHGHLDRFTAIALLEQLTAYPVQEHEVPPVLVKDEHAAYQTDSDAEDQFVKILEQRNFPLPPKSQYRVALSGGSFTVADYAYPDDKVLIFIDGMSKTLHGDPNQQRKDKLQRAKAKMLGYQVVEITAEALKDDVSLALALDELAVYLGRDNLAQ